MSAHETQDGAAEAVAACPNPWCISEQQPDLVNTRPTNRWFVSCEECMIDGPTHPTKADAIAAWNTRAAMPDQGKLVEALTEALERIIELCPDFEESSDEEDAMAEIARAALTRARKIGGGE